MEALGFAVIVVVCPGNKLLSGPTERITLGNCLTVSVTTFEFTAVVQVVLLSKQRYWLVLTETGTALSESVGVVTPEYIAVLLRLVQLPPLLVLICHW